MFPSIKGTIILLSSDGPWSPKDAVGYPPVFHMHPAICQPFFLACSFFQRALPYSTFRPVVTESLVVCTEVHACQPGAGPDGTSSERTSHGSLGCEQDLDALMAKATQRPRGGTCRLEKTSQAAKALSAMGRVPQRVLPKLQ